MKLKAALAALFISLTTPAWAVWAPMSIHDVYQPPAVGEPGLQEARTGGSWVVPRKSYTAKRKASRAHLKASGSYSVAQVTKDGRPRKWCGWYMRQKLGVHDRSFNVARKWATYGSHVPGPMVGAIVVWPHHVGMIVGEGPRGTWVVESGNDSNRVRIRARSVRGAIAFRMA